MQWLSAYRIRGLALALAILIVVLVTLHLTLRQTPHEEGEEEEQDLIFLPSLLSAAIDLAERGGQEVRAVHLQKNIHIESKGETDEGAKEFVTLADKRSHMKIVAGLRLEWPGLKVISEERDKVDPETGISPDLDRSEIWRFKGTPFETDFLPKKDLAVWVDPLDATQEYTEDLLEYVTVMVCVAHEGRPIIGVVHQPFENQTYYAWVGNGNNLPSIEQESYEGDLRIIVSRSHAGSVETLVEEKMGGNVDVIQAGGAGYKALQVLAGRADYYIHVTKIKKWDVCAPNAMLTAVHGSMTTLQGDTIDYSGEGGPVNNYGILASLRERADPELLTALSSE